MAKEFEITKDFDFSPKAGVVMTFAKGERRSNLTRACIQRGAELDALKPIENEGHANG